MVRLILYTRCWLDPLIDRLKTFVFFASVFFRKFAMAMLNSLQQSNGAERIACIRWNSGMERVRKWEHASSFGNARGTLLERRRRERGGPGGLAPPGYVTKYCELRPGSAEKRLPAARSLAWWSFRSFGVGIGKLRPVQV